MRRDARARVPLGHDDDAIEGAGDLPDEQRGITDHDMDALAQAFTRERRDGARGGVAVPFDTDDPAFRGERPGEGQRAGARTVAGDQDPKRMSRRL